VKKAGSCALSAQRLLGQPFGPVQKINRSITQVERLARDTIVVEPLQYRLLFAVIVSPTPALILQTETFDIPDA